MAGTEKKDGPSIKNEVEAAPVLGALDSSATFQESMKLCPASNPSVFVITPYRGQKAQISSTLNASSYKMVSLDTVHSIQGQERDVVIFSLVLMQLWICGQIPHQRWLCLWERRSLDD